MVTGERIQGNPPILRDWRLASYSTGLYNEEGYSYCKRRPGPHAGRTMRTIAIAMCDKDALEPAARWWGLPVRPRGGRATTCRDGPAFRIEASGLRAELIMNEMMKFGLSCKKLKQWREVILRCERVEFIDAKTPLGARTTGSVHGFPSEEDSQDEGSLEEETLALYSTGLFNGGGCSWCWRSGTRRHPMIEIAMCDKDALDPVGRWWGVRVLARGGRAKVCADGPAYQVRASGAKAVAIVGEMVNYGLSDRKKEQWRKVLSSCESGAGLVPR